MPSTSEAQARLMRAVAHGWEKPGGGGPPVSVAKEFVAADKTKAALRTARKYADGGEVNEWEDLPKSPEGRPQITITKPPTPGELVSKYARQASEWFSQPSPIKPETPPAPEFNAAPGQEIGAGVRSIGQGMAEHYKDLVDPFAKNEEGKYVAEQPIPETPGKIPEAIKSDRVTPILGEVAGTFGGSPGAGLGWGALKAAGYGINQAAIAFGLKASQQAFKKSPQLAGGLAAKVAAEQGYLDTSKFTKVGHQLGYMPGGVYRDPQGVPYYLKFGTDIEQVKNENLASKLYQLAGTPAADVNVTHIGGKPGIASKLLQNSHQLSETKIPYNQIPGLHDNFVVDAWLGNHDAVGTGGENPLGNIMIQDGKAVRIDGGGALRFKGSGQLKNHFNDDADEIFSMRDPNFSKRSAQVFGDISDEALKAGAQKVADVDIRQLTDLVARYGPTEDSEKAALVTKLLKRRQYIMDHFGVQPKNAAKPAEAPKSPYEQIPFHEDDPAAVPAPEDWWMQAEKDFSQGSVAHERTAEPVSVENLLEAMKQKVGPQTKGTPEFFNDTILSPKEVDSLLQEKKLGKSALENIASKLVAGTYNYDHWKGAVSLWKIAEHVNPQTAEALFRNLPPSIQPNVGYAIKAMADKIGDSPFDGVGKNTGFLYPGSYPTNYDYYTTQTKKFQIPELLKKDEAFLGNVKENIAKVQTGDAQAPDKALQELHELSEATPATEPKKSLYVPPKKLVYTLDNYSPKAAASQLVKAYGDDVSKIANAMYRSASEKKPEFVDEIYKKLPFEIQVGTNGEIQNLIDKYGDPWKKGFDAKSLKDKHILNALEPVKDWQSYLPKENNFDIPKFPDAETKQRAEQTGHHVGMVFWKGHSKPFKYPEEIKDFSTKTFERANFLTHRKDIAPQYGGQKSPLVARGDNVYQVDFEDLYGEKSYFGVDKGVHRIIEAARSKGADLVMIHNISDYGPAGSSHVPQTQYAFINQSVLRAPNAKFDPSKLHLARPMLGLAGGGLYVYGSFPGREADKMNRGGIPALMHRVKTLARGGPANHPRHPAGMIKSSIPGRTDKIPMSVPPGSYILPSDIPSALGQGNSLAGEKILGTMFKSGPYSPNATQSLSGKQPKAKGFRTPVDNLMGARRRFTEGGSPEEQTGNDDIPIIAAGMEYVVYPDQVREIGHGDMKAGHAVLDKFVLSVRKKNIETLKGLKGPKK